VIVDSLKDAAVGLSADEVGAGYNRARQNACAAGVQVLELHHLRKALTRIEVEHPTIDGVYGSTWITSGAGSVVLLNGKPGVAIVSFHHIKQPACEVARSKSSTTTTPADQRPGTASTLSYSPSSLVG
jgi:hypothetical protein